MARQDPRQSARARIALAINPWRDNNKKPPFKGVQLVAMALLMSDKALTPKKICSWVLSTFSYYRSLAMDAFWALTNDGTGNVPAAQSMRNALDWALAKYELPITSSRLGRGASDDDNIAYTITPLMAEPWLELPGGPSVDETIFPFFKLPAQLRNTIYTMVFRFPRSGLHVQNSNCRITVMSRDLDDAVSSISWMHQAGKGLEANSVSEILSPLLVCRQFYEEAMPVFFGINTFIFMRQDKMSHLIANMPASHRKHIKSIGFEYEWKSPEHPGERQRFEALLDLPNLRNITLWFYTTRFMGRILTLEWKGLPGVKVLRGIQGLEKVECIGSPKALQQFIEGSMTKPKVVGQGSC
ncbi:hypothetical protein LTR17_000804 [Elasticomyces elasticus]|nr:hypothetical protein LTR17_000804 [Elasticomyces elasticus]